MGRPLNKKYFGNRNIGTGGYQIDGGLSNSSNYEDDRIGGEGVASVTIDTVGSYTSALPTATFDAPNIPGGVTATGTVHGKALTAVATAAGSGYGYADVLTQTAGGTGTMATWTVTALKTGTLTILDDGSACDVGDEIEYSGTYGGGTWTTPLRVRVTSSSSGNVTGFTVVTPGVWSGAAAPATTAGATFTQVAAGSDWNAAGLSFTFSDDWGVSAVTVATEGDYTAVTGGAKATSVSPAGGTGATLTITYGVKSVIIDEEGSGYTTVADAGITFSSGAAAATSVLTTDSGAPGSASNQENAIVIYANTSGSGSTGKIGDIIKQTNARSYKIKTADGIGICRLSTDATPASGFAYLIATDSGGATYYVTKLTGNKAVLVNKTGTPEFTDGTSVKWTFGSAEEGYSVTIENA